MANNFWIGNQIPTPAKSVRTVTVAAAASTITAAINSKTETYTVTATDTIASATTNAAVQFAASLIAEFRLVTWTYDGVSTITATGSSDGRPVTITWGGTVTASTATVTATSPSSIDDVLNWSLGALPTGSDVAVFENNSIDCLYGLDALTAVTYTIVRRGSYSGTIGLADNNGLGFKEYFPTHLECAGTSIRLEDSGNGFTRIKSTASTATTITVTGTTAGQLGGETVEITGLPAYSIINVNGGSLAVAPISSQTCLATTIRLSNCAFRAGVGATLTTINAMNSQLQLAGSYTTLTCDRASSVTALEACAGTTTIIEDGTVSWGSTGSPGTVQVKSGGTIDFSTTPGTVAVTAFTLEEGGTINDAYERISKSYAITVSGELSRSTIDLGTSFVLTVS